MDQAKIAGVCSGLAVHFGWKLKGVRLAMIALCIFAAPLGIGLYIAGALLIPAVDASGAWRPAMFGGLFAALNRPYAGAAGASGWGEPAHVPPPPAATATGGWQAAAGFAPVHDAQERVRDLEQRLRDIEAYMTSSRYEFDRQLHAR
jgi:phage shock protein PspC (stress-responsive transcriptional regulator)